eukprot:6515979-Pyramimonas_sp.AAC.1
MSTMFSTGPPVPATARMHTPPPFKLPRHPDARQARTRALPEYKIRRGPYIRPTGGHKTNRRT